MENPDILDAVASSLMDLHNFGFPQEADALFGTPSQESPHQMQVENTETPQEHMDETDTEVSSHVESLDTVFTSSHDYSHLRLAVDSRPESVSEDDTVSSIQPHEESEEEDSREPLSYELSQGFRILREVMADSNKSVNWPFLNEVDPNKDGVPDYLRGWTNQCGSRKVSICLSVLLISYIDCHCCVWGNTFLSLTNDSTLQRESPIIGDS